MHVTIWMFHVRAEREAEFVKSYGPDGEWAALFRRDAGYIGSELLRDEATPLRYVTIDRWSTATAYETFLSRFATEYDSLDRRCDELTEQEMKVGDYSQTGVVATPA